jgi:CRISPR-associated endonuclease/helicase Cas3
MEVEPKVDGLSIIPPHMETVRGTSFLAHLGQNGRGQLIEDHLLAVSEAARTHSQKIGIGMAGATIGLLHDLGKYSSTFQKYLRQMTSTQDTEAQDAARGLVDHSTAGAQTIWQRLKSKGMREGIVGEILALCVASHHSGLIDCIASAGFDNLSKRMKKADSESRFQEAWANAHEAVVARKDQCLEDPELVASISRVITRICQTDANDAICRFKIGLLVRFLFSCLIDADRTDTADAERPTAAALRQRGQYLKWPALISLLDLHLARLSDSTPVGMLRQQVSGECLSASTSPKGTFTLTVPTGGGKTFASLRFALNHAAKWKMERVIYISPYTSIIDQNAEAVRDIIEPAGTEFASVVLEHHSNLTPVEQTCKSKTLSENWDAPIIFTTAVQFLETLFGPRTRGARRMHQMANAVLIFDEIQTIPVRCVHLFNNAVNFLVEQCGTSVVLCTATQPLLRRVDENKGRLNESSEIVSNVSNLFSILRRHETQDRRKVGGWEHSEAAELARLETGRAGSCLVVVNTKREARSIFQECRNRDQIDAFHLSTAMCPAHRLETLAEIKMRLKKHPRERSGVICVSTQLIEAGVDISFGSAIRALAGLDSIAQTAGRCNRHGEAAIGHVHIINLKGDLPQALKEIRIAQRATERVLDENARQTENRLVDLSDPKLIERYFQYYFFERRRDMDYPVNAEQAEREDTLLNMLAGNRLAVSDCKAQPEIYLRQAFMTAAKAFQAIEANTQGVIVPYTSEGLNIINDLCAVHEPAVQFGLLKCAQRFTINVFPHIIEKLQKAGGLHEVQKGTGILYLEPKFYSEEFGLDAAGMGEMEAMIA